MVARADSEAARYEASFARYAKDWMDRSLARNERERKRPVARESAGTLLFQYRAIADAYEVALEPTGNSLSPFIGVLRYTEQTWQCNDANGNDCRLMTSLPVSDVFRHRQGRWGY